MKRTVCSLILIVAGAAVVSLLVALETARTAETAAAAAPVAPKNVILFIGDGMGPEEVKAASFYKTGNLGGLSFEGLPHQAYVTTFAANNAVTDSAAAATAMATGQKVNNGVLSQQFPGDGRDLETILEYYQDRCKRAGLVTTTFVSHATPAAFGAHEPTRDRYLQISEDYLTQSVPDVLMGALGVIDLDKARAAGYTVVTNRAEMTAVDSAVVGQVAGLFDATEFVPTDNHMPFEWDQSAAYATLPHLAEMTASALSVLENSDDGFFLLVEGGRIDHAGHTNKFERNVYETLAFADAVQVALDWAATRPVSDTLIVVTADHETGGLKVTRNNGAGNFPNYTWSTTTHTAVNVPAYAWGVNAERVAGIIDNTDIFDILATGAAALPEACGLRLTQTLQPDYGWIGDSISYTLVVQNRTDAIARDITLRDHIPAGVIVNSVSSSVPLSSSGTASDFTWTLPDLPAGEAARITVMGVITADLGTGQIVTNSVVLTNTAALTATLNLTVTDGMTLTQNFTQTVGQISNPTYFYINGAPLAQGDSYSVTNRLLEVAAPGVLANDSDPNGDGLRARLSAVPKHGTVILRRDGSFTYTPYDYNFYADSFNYQVEDGKGGKAIMEVVLDIEGFNTFLPAVTAEN